MKFTKMQGTGNDYIYINCFEEEVRHPKELSIQLSNRHFGIGADGLVLIMPSETADLRMRMFNADGSESSMCGNASRCIGKYAYEHNLIQDTKLTLETKSGIKSLELEVFNQKVLSVTVDLGIPMLTSKLPETITVDGTDYEFVGISVGNPHAVYFVEDVDGLDLKRIGSAFEHHERFPERTNTEFIRLMDDAHIQMRVWERGSGETWACGTGAAASAAAAVLMGYTGRMVTVSLQGGDLFFRWDEKTGHMFMTGPAVEVFSGNIDINEK